MDMESYRLQKDKIAKTLSVVIDNLFGEQYNQYVHVIGTIGITCDSEPCSGKSILFNFDNTFIKHSDDGCNANSDKTHTAEPFPISTEVVQLPQIPDKVQTETQSHRNDSPFFSASLPVTIVNHRPSLYEVKKEDLTAATTSGKNIYGNNQTQEIIPPPLEIQPVSDQGVPGYEINNQNTGESMQTINQLSETRDIDSGEEATAPHLDIVEQVSFDRNSVPELPVLEKQVTRRDSHSHVDSPETIDNDNSFFIVNPDSSSESLIVMNLSERGPPHSAQYLEVLGQISKAGEFTDEEIEFVKVQDLSSNVGDTMATVWNTMDSVPNKRKKQKNREFKDLLAKSCFDLETSSPRQQSNSSLFLTLVNQLSKFTGHPRQGIGCVVVFTLILGF